MSEEATESAEPREALRLKHPEAEVSPEKPWRDDALDRKQLAERLTRLIRNEQEPFIISIDGEWGSGKSFLLKRWQRELEGDGFRAIYYNAWEDDFCDDPFLAIIGQLSEHFRESKFKQLVRKAGQVAVQVIKQSAIAEASRLSGFNLGAVLSRLAGRDLLQAYLDQRESRDCLKEQLRKLSAEVAEETGRPLVFIIDELDRCRPTFAIELAGAGQAYLRRAGPGLRFRREPEGDLQIAAIGVRRDRRRPLSAPLFRHGVFAACYEYRSVLQKVDVQIPLGGTFRRSEWGFVLQEELCRIQQTYSGVSEPLRSPRSFSARDRVRRQVDCPDRKNA